MKNKVLSPIGMIILGGALGASSKLFDIYTQNLGNIFSEFGIWILLGVLITLFSRTRRLAMLNILLFCISMLATYYIAAELTNSVYGYAFIKGWTIFALFSPLFAYFTWMSKAKGIFSVIIRLGILAVSVFCSLFLFSVNIWDLIINLMLGYFLFIKKYTLK